MNLSISKKIMNLSKNSSEIKNESSHNDINDISYIFIKAIHIIDNFFTFLYLIISFCFKFLFLKKNFFFQKICFNSIFIMLLFSFPLSQNVPIGLIMSAYFNNSKVTHISYDKIIKEREKINEDNFGLYQREKEKISNRNNKNCYNHDDNNDNSIYDKYYNYIINEDNILSESEFHIINLIPVKRVLITFMSFFLLYITIKFTFYSKLIKSMIVNLISLYISYKFLEYLYSSNYFLASGFIFILFFYFLKALFDSIFCNLKFEKIDFEIYSVHLSANNKTQFCLKFIILFSGTSLSGYLSFYYFNLYFNYIAFYMCLFTFVIFLSNCLEKNYLEKYKYCKNILIFILGAVNFIINKISNKKYYSQNPDEDNNNQKNINSYYLISDIFSLLCFDYIDDYIEYKYQNYLLKNKNFKKIFSFKDIAFIGLFTAFIMINIYGIIFQEYTCSYIAMSLSQKINNTFPYIFSYNIGRIFNHIMILIFLFAQYEISSSGDEYLTGIILNINIGRDNIYLILKLLSLGLFLLNLIYTNYLYYYSNECHQNLYHYFKGFDDFDNINDIIQEFANKDDDSDDYEDDDDDYDFINKYNKKIYDKLRNYHQTQTGRYKIQVITKNISDNKIKDNLFFVDFSLCYVDTILSIILAIYYEQNIIIQIIYMLIVLFLISRKFFLLNETKVNGVYYFYFLISFIFSSRLIFFTAIDCAYFTIVMKINMFGLLTYYCLNNKRNIFVTLFIIAHLMIAYYKKNFTFFIVVLVLFILTLIYKSFKSKKTFKVEKYDEQNSHLSLIFLLSLLTFFLIQLYGINKIISLVQNSYNCIINYMNDFNLWFSDKNSENIRLMEYYTITDIIDWIDNKIK